MKGISEVVTIILLLIIVIVIVGMSFTFFNAVVQSSGETAQKETQQQTQRFGENFKVESTNANIIYIRNVGYGPINTSSLAFFVDGILINTTSPSQILGVGEVVGVELNVDQLNAIGETTKLKVSGSVFSYHIQYKYIAGYGGLSITSNVTGAQISIGGVLTGNFTNGMTPVIITNLTAGMRVVSLNKTGYYDNSSVSNVVPNSVTPVHIVLQYIVVAGYGNVSITSNVAGAQISLDSVLTGNFTNGATPVKITNISEGVHTIKLNLTNYIDNQTTVNVVAGAEVGVRIEMGQSMDFTVLFNDSSEMKLYEDPISLTTNGGNYGSTIRMWIMINDTNNIYFDDHDCVFDTTLGTKNAIKNGNGSYVYYFDKNNIGGATQVSFTALRCTSPAGSLQKNFFFQENYTTYSTVFGDVKPVGLVFHTGNQNGRRFYDNYSVFLNNHDIPFNMINISDPAVNLNTVLPNYDVLIVPEANNYGSYFSTIQRTAVETNIKRGMDVWFSNVLELDTSNGGGISVLCGVSQDEYAQSGNQPHLLDAKFIPYGYMGDFSTTSNRYYNVNESSTIVLVNVFNAAGMQIRPEIIMHDYQNGTVSCSGITTSNGGVYINEDQRTEPKAFVGFLNHAFQKHYGRSAFFKSPLYFTNQVDDPSDLNNDPDTIQKDVITALWNDFRIPTTFGTQMSRWNVSYSAQDEFYSYFMGNLTYLSSVSHGWLHDLNPSCESGYCPCQTGEFHGMNNTGVPPGITGYCVFTNYSIIDRVNNMTSVYKNVMPQFQREGKYHILPYNRNSHYGATFMMKYGIIAGYNPAMQLLNNSNSTPSSNQNAEQGLDNNITHGYSTRSWLTKRPEDGYYSSVYRVDINTGYLLDKKKVNNLLLFGNSLTAFGHVTDYDGTTDNAYVGWNNIYNLMNRSDQKPCYLKTVDFLDYGLSARADKINYDCGNLQGIEVTGRDIQVQHVQWIMPKKDGSRWYAYTDTHANYTGVVSPAIDNRPTTVYGAGTFTFDFTDDKTEMYDVVHLNYADSGVYVTNARWNANQLSVDVTCSGPNKVVRFRIPVGAFTQWKLVYDGGTVQTGSGTGVISYTIPSSGSHTLVLTENK